MRQGARGWCTGVTQRDGKEGGGSGWGTHVHPWMIHVNVWQNLESPLDCKEIQPVHPKGDQSWVFIGRTDAEAETPTFWPPHAKS